MQLFKKCLAECLGTFVLVLFGCGTAVAVGCNGAVANGAYFMTAFAFGLVIVAASQFVGAIIGGAVLKGLFPESGLGTNGVYDNNIWASLLIEIILTFVFVLAILGVTSKVQNGAVAGIVIGLTLILVHIFGIHFTGTSVNPARSFGPAVFAGGDAFANVWIFIIAPLVGAVLAALVYKYMADGQEEETADEEAPKAAAPVRSSAPRRSNKKKRR